jgi:hypothetical protein
MDSMIHGTPRSEHFKKKKKHKLNEKDGTHCDDEAPIEGKLNLILLLTRHA